MRDATDSDLEVMLTLRNAPEVTRWMIDTHTEPDAFGARWRTMRDRDDEYSCVAELDHEVVGIGHLDVLDGMGQPGRPPRTEAMIGYEVAPAAWGRGIASRLARGLLTACFADLGVRRVTAGAFADNHASLRVLEKAGMRREQYGVRDSWHAELGWIDGVTYAVLREEWAG